MLSVVFSFIMLGFGGAGGLINMSYQLDSSIHNTQWITGHFHLIFGGAIVIMYFVIAYDLWPHLTGRPLASFRLMRDRSSGSGYRNDSHHLPMALRRHSWNAAAHGVLRLFEPRHSPQAMPVVMSAFGGFILVLSAVLFFVVLARGHRRPWARSANIASAWPSIRRSASRWALNSHALWIVLMIGLTITNYGFPILISWAPDTPCPPSMSEQQRGEPPQFRNEFREHRADGCRIAMSGIFSLVVLPYAEPELRLGGLWDTICSAAGFPPPPLRRGADPARPSRLERRDLE